MIATDEDALICDLAEVYHIYDYRSLPLSKVATFSVGLREESRIKMKMNNMKYSLDTILLASLVDRLSVLLWSNSKESEQPKSILAKLLGEEEIDNNDIQGFNTPEEFEREWKRINEGSD